MQSDLSHLPHEPVYTTGKVSAASNDNSTYLRLDSAALGLPGESIVARVAGTGGPTLVLVHGNSASAKCWDKQFESGLRELCRLVAIDLPGHGLSMASANPAQRYSLPGMAQCLVRALSALDVSKAIYVGWSLGGHVLLEALDHLQGPQGLMILGCPPTNSSLRGFKHFPVAATQASPSLDDLADHIESLVDSESGRSAFAEDFWRADPQFRANFGCSIKRGEFKDEVVVVAKSSVPLAMVHGAKDDLVDLAYLQHLQIPALWRGYVQVIPAALHAPQWDASGSFNSLLIEFVREITRSPAL